MNKIIDIHKNITDNLEEINIKYISDFKDRESYIKGINLYKNEENAVLIITHNTRILQNLKVDYVHILVDGKIVKTGSSELAEEIEKEGYGKYKNEN